MKIYIIDDDHLSTFLTMNMLSLEDATHDISTFLIAADALEALQEVHEDNVPELMFVDLNMPVMDGWDFLNALAPMAHRLRERCSIYVLTSSLDVSDTLRLKDYPFVAGLIQKPIRSEDIHIVAC
ncbi:two-component system response regulator [Pontibacter toksunensis]|uniref:Two-component system response regulator n=1 Tax=Pontibacter toksunensis TaxID=1332631 RepID=A0ABW6BUX2_9BACT